MQFWVLHWGVHPLRRSGPSSAYESKPTVYSVLPNFTLISTVAVRAISCKFDQILNLETSVAILIFIDHGQILHARVDPWCTLWNQISPSSVYCVALEGYKNPKFDHIFNFSVLWWRECTNTVFLLFNDIKVVSEP